LKTFLEKARTHGRFRNAATKLEWAKRHIQQLDSQSTEFLDSHWEFRLRRSTAPIGGTLLTFKPVRPVPLRFGLMVGDVANNLRSALDHIVWVVTAPHCPEEKHKFIQYPLVEKGKSLRKEIKDRLVHLAGSEPERIVKLDRDDLAGLERLNNEDKHRLITVLGHVAEIRGLRGEEGNPHRPYVPFNDLKMGPDLGYVRDLSIGGLGGIKADRDGVVDQNQFDMTIQLVFADGGPFARLPVVATLIGLAETVEKVLVEFHSAFPSMFASGYFADNPDPL
jgi:hypothetical protein